MHVTASELQARLSDTLESVELIKDVIAAENGNRESFCRLLQYASNSPAVASNQRISDIAKRFSVDPYKSNDFFFDLHAPLANNVDVMKLLASESYHNRLYALHTIYSLRLNSYLPDVARLVESDDNLYVVQFSIYILNDAFSENAPRGANLQHFNLLDCVSDINNFKASFYSQWGAYKDIILSRRPKEIRETSNPDHPNLNMIYIFDPETEK